MQFPASAGNTDLALGALALISGDPLSFINAAFAAYWTDHADLNDPTVIAHLTSETIGENFVFDEKTCIDALESSQAEADELGIVDAPAFIIQDQLFIGREHLTWLEEIKIYGEYR